MGFRSRAVRITSALLPCRQIENDASGPGDTGGLQCFGTRRIPINCIDAILSARTAVHVQPDHCRGNIVVADNRTTGPPCWATIHDDGPMPDPPHARRGGPEIRRSTIPDSTAPRAAAAHEAGAQRVGSPGAIGFGTIDAIEVATSALVATVVRSQLPANRGENERELADLGQATPTVNAVLKGYFIATSRTATAGLPTRTTANAPPRPGEAASAPGPTACQRRRRTARQASAWATPPRRPAGYSRND